MANSNETNRLVEQAAARDREVVRRVEAGENAASALEEILISERIEEARRAATLASGRAVIVSKP